MYYSPGTETSADALLHPVTPDSLAQGRPVRLDKEDERHTGR